MRVLVTGGAGFIGSHVVDRLVADGHEPVVLDALIPQAHGGEKPTWVGELVHADARDQSALRPVLRGVDAVCHQAAMVGQCWLVADLLDWRPHRRFAAWHDRAVFHFLTEPDDRARYRAVLDDTLDADGVLVIATFAQDGPRACSGLPTVGYSADELLHELGGPGEWDDPVLARIELARRREHHVTPTGVDQAFTWMALRRRPASAGVDDRAGAPERGLGQPAGAATIER